MSPEGGGCIEYLPASPSDIDVVRGLFEEYASTLGIDLWFQDFQAELSHLPGKYAPPDGALILAVLDGAACGCVALRRIDATTGEMKRLYVRPRQRGRGIGAALARRSIEEARARGYHSIRLDTLPSMGSALAVYRSLGFRKIPPYVFNPIEGALFLEKTL